MIYTKKIYHSSYCGGKCPLRRPLDLLQNAKLQFHNGDDRPKEVGATDHSLIPLAFNHCCTMPAT